MSDDTYYDGGEDSGQEQAPADAYDQLGEIGYSEEEAAATRQLLDGIIDQATQPLREDLHYVTSELQERQ